MKGKLPVSVSDVVEQHADDSTSYTIRRRPQTRPAQSLDETTTIHQILKRAAGEEDSSNRRQYGDLMRKSNIFPLYSNLLQAVSNYLRVRSSNINFTSVSLTTAFLFEHRICHISRGKTFRVYKCPSEYFPRHYGVPFTGPSSSHSPERFVALKALSRPSMYEGAGKQSSDGDVAQAITCFIKELQVLAHPPLRAHPNIIDILGIAWEDGADGEIVWPVICVEHATQGTLAMFQNSQSPLSNRTKNHILLEIAVGLEALHMCGIVHGDLKASNVLILSDPTNRVGFTAKISDFADVWIVDDIAKGERVHVNRGTIASCSPEFGKEIDIDEMRLIDTYSYGLLVWRVHLDGRDPFTSYFQKFGAEYQTYNSFVLGSKSSDLVLTWALEFANNLNAAGLSQIFSLTLQHEPIRRECQWRRIYGHLEEKLDDDKDPDNLRNLYMLLCFQKEVSWAGNEETSKNKFGNESSKTRRDVLRLRTRNLRKEVSWCLEEESPIDINDFPELRDSADMEEVNIDFDKLDKLDHRVKKQAFTSAAKAHERNLRQQLEQFHLFERFNHPLLFKFQCYLHGFGVPRDPGLALQFLRDAAADDSEEAAALIKRLHDALGFQLSPELNQNLEQLLTTGAASNSVVALEDLENLFPEVYNRLPEIIDNNLKYPRGSGLPFEKMGISLGFKLADIPFHDASKLYQYALTTMSGHNIHNINQLRYKGRDTLLHAAVARSPPECVVALCELEASPDVRNDRGETPWLVASRSGNWDAICTMHYSSPSPSHIEPTNLRENPLHWLPMLERRIASDLARGLSYSHPHLESLHKHGLLVETAGSIKFLTAIFLERGSDPNLVANSSSPFEPVAVRGAFGYSPTSLTKVHSRAISGTPVHRAVSYGALESLRCLLMFGGRPDEVSALFSAPAIIDYSIFVKPVLSPVQISARLHRAQCLKTCIQHFREANGSDMISSHGCFNDGIYLNDIADLPPSSQDACALAVSNLKKAGQHSLLAEAIQNLPDTAVTRLCIHGADHIKAMKETIDTLFQMGASRTCLSGWGENCIGTAALHGNASTLRYLLDLTGKEFIDEPLYMNIARLTTTPLGIACQRGSQEMFDILLEFGASLNAKPPPFGPLDNCIARKSLSPLHVCAISRHEQTAEFASSLLDKGAEVDPGDEYLPTPLYFALMQGEFGLAQLLIDRGANLRSRQYAPDGDGYRTLVGAVIYRLFSALPFGTGCDPVNILDFLLNIISKRDPSLFLVPMDMNGLHVLDIAAIADSVHESSMTSPDEVLRRALWARLYADVPKGSNNKRETVVSKS